LLLAFGFALVKSDVREEVHNANETPVCIFRL
jgi:hypothetical protein